MAYADQSMSGNRVTALIIVALIHVAVGYALVTGLAYEAAKKVIQRVTTVDIKEEVKKEEPPPPPPEKADATPQGAEGASGKQAVAKEVAAPKPRVVIAQKNAPAAASTGNADTSGARDSGDGTGAGGQGSGTGAGGSGDGQGAGGASKPVKIAGDIKSARDYPREGREARNGDYVIVALTVGTDGRVKACRVHRPSRDAAADRITCDLATRRFRFKPATDRSGQPVEGVYGWQQRWFDKGED